MLTRQACTSSAASEKPNSRQSPPILTQLMRIPFQLSPYGGGEGAWGLMFRPLRQAIDYRALQFRGTTTGFRHRGQTMP